ncbi:hypothetical protein AFLA_000073 [Aspergillus flavus NRRL3357]|nr:hypothetical protein AFLA_000073 [Aspergillus flavus NRRL3357]
MGARAAGHRANGADRAGPTSPRRGGVYIALAGAGGLRHTALGTARNEPGTGARRMSRGSRARPLLDTPNPVDSLDDPTKDAARRPLESRNHGWDGRLPPTTDLDRADIVRANVPGSGSGWRGAHFVWGGPCVDPRAHTKWASQGRSALEGRPPANWSPPRARPTHYSLQEGARARPYIDPGVRVSVSV